MPLVETESLVLKHYNLSEADRIVVFLTLDHGIIRGVAKGAKRLNSRFGSALEPFSAVNLEYFQKEDRELVSIQKAELIRSAFGPASDPEFLRSFSYLVELLTAFLPPHEPNPLSYRMVRACLEAAKQASLTAIRLYFEIWILRLSGYLPDWGKCNECGRAIVDGERAFLDMHQMINCSRCFEGGDANLITLKMRKLVRQAQKLSPGEFSESAENDPEGMVEVSRIVGKMISRSLELSSEAARSFSYTELERR